MFKLLSNESNIFSIPIYIGFLLVLILITNVFKVDFFSFDSVFIAMGGFALGYFCINAVQLTYQTHIPLFIYTLLILGLYSEQIDIGLSISLFINGLLILMLTIPDERIKRKNYLLVGFLLALNFVFLPATWPMAFFVILHIVATSERIGLQLFRLFFGATLCALSYFSIAYFLGWHSWDERYLPIPILPFLKENENLLYLSPLLLMLLMAITDHFIHYNKKSPSSRYKYTFLLTFTLAQIVTIILYMETASEYLLLLAMPLSIFFTRFLRFRAPYWQKELGIWVILFSLVAYRIAQINI